MTRGPACNTPRQWETGRRTTSNSFPVSLGRGLANHMQLSSTHSDSSPSFPGHIGGRVKCPGNEVYRASPFCQVVQGCPSLTTPCTRHHRSRPDHQLVNTHSWTCPQRSLAPGEFQLSSPPEGPRVCSGHRGRLEIEAPCVTFVKAFWWLVWGRPNANGRARSSTTKPFLNPLWQEAAILPTCEILKKSVLLCRFSISCDTGE